MVFGRFIKNPIFNIETFTNLSNLRNDRRNDVFDKKVFLLATIHKTRHLVKLDVHGTIALADVLAISWLLTLRP
jgi:hypothetical protein